MFDSYVALGKLIKLWVPQFPHTGATVTPTQMAVVKMKVYAGSISCLNNYSSSLLDLPFQKRGPGSLPPLRYVLLTHSRVLSTLRPPVSLLWFPLQERVWGRLVKGGPGTD